MKTTLEIMQAACAVKSAVMSASTEEKNAILRAMASRLTEAIPAILAENAADIEAAKGRISPVMIDRLTLTESRIRSMAQGILDVVNLPDPAWRILETVHRNGLTI